MWTWNWSQIRPENSWLWFLTTKVMINSNSLDFKIPQRLNKTIINRIKRCIVFKNKLDDSESEAGDEVKEESWSSITSKSYMYKTPKSQILEREEVKGYQSSKMDSWYDSVVVNEDLMQSFNLNKTGIVYEISGIICRNFKSEDKDFKIFTTFEKDQWRTNSQKVFYSLDSVKEHMKQNYLAPVLIAYK